MKRNGASLAVYALEQIGVRKTFGIPGVHNSAIYDQLFKSAHIEPIIVSSELSAGFMADAISRTSDSIGTVVVVQGAGVTHLSSAIGQALVDNIPLLVISGSNRQVGKDFQMHYFNLDKSLEGLVKKSFQVKDVSQIITIIYEAYNLAISGSPGPVFIEIPLEIQIEQTDLPFLDYKKTAHESKTENSAESVELQIFAGSETAYSKIKQAVELLSDSKLPGIYIGRGALNASDEVKQLAEMLGAPISTTLQGVGVFAQDHPLHTGFGFGNFAVPAAKNAFKNCDCLIAVGVRFSEIATANYLLPVPENLIHIDINHSVFHKNYHAKIAIEGDSKIVLNEVLSILKSKSIKPKTGINELSKKIEKDKLAYKMSWLDNSNEQLVSPGFFFNALRNYFPQESILISGNGTHRFYAAELYPVKEIHEFVCPSDSDAMGYGIPACIAAKLIHKSKTVIGIIGEAGLLVNGLEMITAQYYKLGLLIFVLRDWVAHQNEISDRERAATLTNPMHRSIDIEKFAASVHAEYYVIRNDIDISGALTKAKEVIKTGKSIIVEVIWDNSRKSAYASGLLKPDLSRISFLEKLKILFKSRN